MKMSYPELMKWEDAHLQFISRRDESLIIAEAREMPYNGKASAQLSYRKSQSR